MSGIYSGPKGRSLAQVTADALIFELYDPFAVFA
jgi:hypothetical protein